MRIAMALAICVQLIGCGESAQEEMARRDRASRHDAEQAWLKRKAEPQLAAAEVDERLSNLVVKNGVIFISNDESPLFFSVVGIPIWAPWVVRCNTDGLYLEFTGPISSDVSPGEQV